MVKKRVFSERDVDQETIEAIKILKESNTLLKMKVIDLNESNTLLKTNISDLKKSNTLLKTNISDLKKLLDNVKSDNKLLLFSAYLTMFFNVFSYWYF